MSVSLEASLFSCRVNGNNGNYAQSYRTFDPNVMLCPTPNNHDVFGRKVCIDTLPTKSAGCNSALDRIVVENEHRPRYEDYIKPHPIRIQGANVNNTISIECPYHKNN
jgi:hypothetical protein